MIILFFYKNEKVTFLLNHIYKGYLTINVGVSLLELFYHIHDLLSLFLLFSIIFIIE